MDINKEKGLELLNECTGGFFLITYDEDGYCEMYEGIGDNHAAYKACKLSDLLNDARMKYINWRTKEKI